MARRTERRLICAIGDPLGLSSDAACRVSEHSRFIPSVGEVGLDHAGPAASPFSVATKHPGGLEDQDIAKLNVLAARR